MRTEEAGHHKLSAARLKTSKYLTQPTCEGSSSRGRKNERNECERKLSDEPSRLEVERETLATNLLYSYWQSIHEFAPISSCANQSAEFWELLGAKELSNKQKPPVFNTVPDYLMRFRPIERTSKMRNFCILNFEI